MIPYEYYKSKPNASQSGRGFPRRCFFSLIMWLNTSHIYARILMIIVDEVLHSRYRFVFVFQCFSIMFYCCSTLFVVCSLPLHYLFAFHSLCIAFHCFASHSVHNWATPKHLLTQHMPTHLLTIKQRQNCLWQLSNTNTFVDN